MEVPFALSTDGFHTDRESSGIQLPESAQTLILTLPLCVADCFCGYGDTGIVSWPEKAWLCGALAPQRELFRGMMMHSHDGQYVASSQFRGGGSIQDTGLTGIGVGNVI